MRSMMPLWPLAFVWWVAAALLLPPGPVALADDDTDWGFRGDDDDDDDGDDAGTPTEDGDGGFADDGGFASDRTVDPFLELEQPGRILGRLGVGLGLRLGTDEQFSQDTLAPVFLEVLGGYVLPGSGLWRHGVTLDVSTGLTADGPEVAEVELFRQYAFTAAYLAYLRFDMDFVVTARIGPSFSVGSATTRRLEGAFIVESSDFQWTWGGEAVVSGQYMLLAGFGVYADIGVSVFAGAGETVHAIASVSAGAVIDYELIQ